MHVLQRYLLGRVSIRPINHIIPTTAITATTATAAAAATAATTATVCVYARRLAGPG